MFQKILCKLGFHKWSRPVRTSHGFTSNIYDVKKTCTRCGRIRKYVESK